VIWGCVEIYHLFSAYTAVPRSVILPVAMLAESELLRGAEPPAERERTPTKGLSRQLKAESVEISQ
jgi:hypothetical protein